MPGLAIAARTLLNVWDCLQKVDVRSLFYFIYFGVSPSHLLLCDFFFSLRDGVVICYLWIMMLTSWMDGITDEPNGVPPSHAALCGYFDQR